MKSDLKGDKDPSGTAFVPTTVRAEYYKAKAAYHEAREMYRETKAVYHAIKRKLKV